MRKLKNTKLKEYEAWYAAHEPDCAANHTGSSGKMEINAIIKIFMLSVEKDGVKYFTYIDDGDNK